MWFGFLPSLFSYFAKAGDQCPLPGRGDNTFFGFPHWWQYLQGRENTAGECEPFVKMPDGLWAIALAIIDMLLYLAGIVAVVAIIIAGFMFLSSGGNAEKAASARKRVINAFAGLVIVLLAASVVSFIGNSLS